MTERDTSTETAPTSEGPQGPEAPPTSQPVADEPAGASEPATEGQSGASTSDAAAGGAEGTTAAAAAGGSESADASTEGTTKKSWRSRARAGKSEKPEKAAKAEKAEKAEKKAKPAKQSRQAKREQKDQEPVAEKKKRRSPIGVGRSVSSIRTLVARLVWVVCLVFALVLAITALLIALKANSDNEGVRFLVDFASRVDLGIFDLMNPIKDFDTDQGPAQDVKTALFNYGIGAVVWLIIGRIADKVIRP